MDVQIELHRLMVMNEWMIEWMDERSTNIHVNRWMMDDGLKDGCIDQ